MTTTFLSSSRGRATRPGFGPIHEQPDPGSELDGSVIEQPDPGSELDGSVIGRAEGPGSESIALADARHRG